MLKSQTHTAAALSSRRAPHLRLGRRLRRLGEGLRLADDQPYIHIYIYTWNLIDLFFGVPTTQNMVQLPIKTKVMSGFQVIMCFIRLHETRILSATRKATTMRTLVIDPIYIYSQLQNRSPPSSHQPMAPGTKDSNRARSVMWELFVPV